jgi:acyl-coenzyme A synthetase/AMP-(fatty) acid ligase
MLSGLAHDPLLRDVFTPLWVGATLYVPEPERIASPGYLASWMERTGITVTHLTPAMGQLIASADEGGPVLPDLRYAFFGGDRLSVRDAAHLRRMAPRVTCVNFYGSTETPQAMGYHVLPAPGEAEETARVKEAVPLGRGIPGVQLLIQNRSGRLAGVGELGEIHIRSPYLALGYLGDQALTAERFLANPYNDGENDRVFRSGDLARYLPDGAVEFAGRGDRQVKVRGFRVELGEIEAVLDKQAGIRKSFAVVRPDGPSSEGLLVAYVVPEPDAGTIGDHLLRAALKSTLPGYMIPAAFVFMDDLPLTPNGKVDQRALPSPEPRPAGDEDPFVAPRTQTEEAVAEIWADVLRREAVGIFDDFFALGGHSLLATRVLSRVRDTFALDVPLARFFEAPTVAGFAAAIEEMVLDELESLSDDEALHVTDETGA